MPTTSPGYQRLIAINGYPLYLEEPFEGFPTQDMQQRHYVQGGPRCAVYYIGYKWVKGNMKIPIYLTSGGEIAQAVKEILLCAEYPIRELKIDTNYVLSRYYFTDDAYEYDLSTPNKGFNIYEQMSFTTCGITELTLSVPNNGPAIIDLSFVGLINRTQEAVVPDPDASGLMRRNITYVDCDVYLENPEFTWDTTRSFTLKITNEIEPILAFQKDDCPPDDDKSTDQPQTLAMGKSEISGEIRYSVDRGSLSSERETFPSGGLNAQGLTLDLSGLIIARFPFVLMHLTEQPIALDLLERITKYEAVFGSSNLAASTTGHIFTFPSLT